MTDLEQKLNSGKVYQVIAQENQDPRFYEYLEKMEKYNTLGYTESCLLYTSPSPRDS